MEYLDYFIEEDQLRQLEYCNHSEYMDYNDALKWAEGCGISLDNLVLSVHDACDYCMGSLKHIQAVKRSDVFKFGD